LNYVRVVHGWGGICLLTLVCLCGNCLIVRVFVQKDIGKGMPSHYAPVGLGLHLLQCLKKLVGLSKQYNLNFKLYRVLKVLGVVSDSLMWSG
jgi:hypothetical protein